MKQQLLLGVALCNDSTFENYYPGRNAHVNSALREAVMHNIHACIYLFGQEGVGRSHLLQACCHLATTLGKTPFYLPLHEIPFLSKEMFEGLEAMDVVCIDDVDCIAGNLELEEALFACYNRVRDAGKVLIVSSYALPLALSFVLPDLVSRLSWGLTFHLETLNDEEKKEALQFRAKKRGFELPDSVVTYILKRSARKSKTLFELLDKLDQASSAELRKVTIPFVREVMH